MSANPDTVLYVAIPLMDEGERLPALLEDIRDQRYRNFVVCYCVNQPDSWWEDPEHLSTCLDNQTTLQQLETLTDHPCIVLDHSSRGKGWNTRNYGVGQARRMAMDACVARAQEGDLLLSLDADTRFGPDYFGSVVTTFAQYPRIASLAIPYYHPLSGQEDLDRAMLRYEIYMRYYALNLWRTGTPYTFTALGSAMACRMSAYRRIGGMTPMKSGEDFYFLQKLRKYAPMGFWNPEKVYPAGRLSNRVFFGTGPALIKGIEGNWDSYPLYAAGLFDQVKQTISGFPMLFTRDIETSMDAFLKAVFKEDSVWEPLRKNHTRKANFIRACHEKIDALRILQFLKSNTLPEENQNGINLKQFLRVYYNEQYNSLPEGIMNRLDFRTSSIADLNAIRDLLAMLEEQIQRNSASERIN